MQSLVGEELQSRHEIVAIATIDLERTVHYATIYAIRGMVPQYDNHVELSTYVIEHTHLLKYVSWPRPLYAADMNVG